MWQPSPVYPKHPLVWNKQESVLLNEIVKREIIGGSGAVAFSVWDLNEVN